MTGAPIGHVSRGNFRYLNGEDGQAKVAATIASTNLEPMYQDEYILGFQKQLSDHFSLGVRGIYRDLKTAIDDNCDYTALLEAIYAKDPNAHPVYPAPGFPYCRMFNPGSDAIWLTDVEDTGVLEEFTIPGARLSPEAKRKYSAIEFFFDGNWDKFFMQGSYTYAKSKGNTEGGVKSDIGQADTSVTQDFDYIELTVDTFGYLPNDRRHSLKLFGNYDITEEWAVGANVLVQSGRPINCLGVLDRDPLRAPGAAPRPDRAGYQPGTDNGYNPHPYGSSFMRCNNIPSAAWYFRAVAVDPEPGPERGLPPVLRRGPAVQDGPLQRVQLAEGDLGQRSCGSGGHRQCVGDLPAAAVVPGAARSSLHGAVRLLSNS